MKLRPGDPSRRPVEAELPGRRATQHGERLAWLSCVLDTFPLLLWKLLLLLFLK